MHLSLLSVLLSRRHDLAGQRGFRVAAAWSRALAGLRSEYMYTEA